MELKINIKQLNLQIEDIDNGIIMRCIDIIFNTSI
jgi:hypothetical protein